ncbi:MAG: hypothetical protein QXT43_01715, partial [Candidatus Micrarchaeaceae archaeon]
MLDNMLAHPSLRGKGIAHASRHSSNETNKKIRNVLQIPYKNAPPGKKSQSKAQSAMEYLMTYGWAILIIAVVLGALFELGVFNSNTFAPKAPPGACQVFRPNGPGTTSFINLEGLCNGELPEYVGS